MERFVITKVVSRNFFLDFVSKLQNIFGFNLTYYEKMVKRGTEQIEEEIRKNKWQVTRSEFVITQLNNDAVVIMMYGERI